MSDLAGELNLPLSTGRRMLEALSPGEREIFLELMVKMTQPASDGSEANEPARPS